MACNCKKSAAQKYNLAAQPLAATPTALNMGASAGLPSGPSIKDRGNNVGIAHSGLYRITAQLLADITTAGTLYVQLAYNGQPLDSTLKALPVAVGATELSLDHLIYLVVPQGCACPGIVCPVDVYAWVSTPGAGAIQSLTANVLREA